jgi:hypothetical protein
MITIKNPVSIRELREVKFKKPKTRGSYWQGMPHINLVEILTDAIVKREWEILKIEIALSKDTQDMTFAFTIHIPKIKLPEEHDLSLGIITSNARRFSMRFYWGVINPEGIGMLLGEIESGKKHTTSFDLASEIFNILNLLHNRAKKANSRISDLVESKLDLIMQHSIVCEAGERQMLPWSRIGQARELMGISNNHPTANAWKMYECFCRIVQKSPVFKQMEQMNLFRKLIPIITDEPMKGI